MRTRNALLGVVACLLAAAPPTTARAAPGTGNLWAVAARQEVEEGQGILRVEAVSPWVAADGVFQVRFAPSTDVPPGARLAITVHQRLAAASRGTLRDALDAAVTDGPPAGLLHDPIEIPVELAGDPVRGLEIDLALRPGPGDAERVLIPTAGIHPVGIELTSAEGDALWSTTVFLNRLPSTMPTGRDGRPAVTAVQLLVSLDSDPAFAPDGTTSFTTDELAAITSVEQLLGGLVTTPLTVALRPNTLEGLRLSGDPRDAAFLERAKTAAWNLPRQSYVRVDAAGLVDSGGGELQRQIGVGDAVVTGTLDRPPDASSWLLDDTVDTAAARFLVGLGVRHFVMSPERLEPSGAAVPVTSRVFAVDGVAGATVSAFDTALPRQLLDLDTDTGLVANHVSTRLMADWFDASGGAGSAFPGVVASVIIPPGTPVETVRTLAAPLTGDGPLQLRPFPEATADDRGTAQAGLRDREGGDYRTVVGRSDAVGARVDGYRSMTSASDARAITWDLVNDQTAALFLLQVERERMWRSVDRGIDERLARIQRPPPRTIVLTSRTGSIPLRFRNGLDTDVRLVMRTRSSRLEFPEGEVTEVVLTPGENRVDVPVVVRASGSSLLRIELRSPDGALQLPDTTVTVRSSSISGVGAALSVISLVFLAFWWVHTHLRRRRARSTGPAARSPDA